MGRVKRAWEALCLGAGLGQVETGERVPCYSLLLSSPRSADRWVGAPWGMGIATGVTVACWQVNSVPSHQITAIVSNITSRCWMDIFIAGLLPAQSFSYPHHHNVSTASGSIDVTDLTQLALQTSCLLGSFSRAFTAASCRLDRVQGSVCQRACQPADDRPVMWICLYARFIVHILTRVSCFSQELFDSLYISLS